MNAPRILRSPGPVAEAFIASRAFIKIIIGPVGSGKTMAALQCPLNLATRQGPVRDERTGVLWRRLGAGVIRESYPSLEATTLKSWENIIPRTEGKFSAKVPITHRFRRAQKTDEDGRVLEGVDIDYEFRAIGDQSVEAACRGWERHIVVVDEADLQPPDLIPFLTGRVGRFTNLDPKLVVDQQIVASMNMPDVENHMYRLAMDRELGGLTDDELEKLQDALNGRPLIETFIQPGGMEADAENLHNLPNGRGYYLLQLAANKHKPGYIDRMVHNKPVPVMHGMPVNPTFSHREHVAEGLAWDRKFKLIVGVDQGALGAAVVMYRNHMGQIRTIGEVVNRTSEGTSLVKWSAEAFGKKLRSYLLERFPGLRAEHLRVVGDPAMFAASDRAADDYDWRLVFQRALGFPVYRAKSNKPGLRNEAIWKAMDERGGYQVSAACKHLIKAHAGGYRYSKETLGTGEVRGDLSIADTIYTHVADAEQYAALEGDHVINDLRHGGLNRRPVQVVNRYDPFASLGG